MIDIIEGQAIDIAAIMPVMNAAFNPEFGEAWTAAQCLSMLCLPANLLLIAQRDGIAIGFALSRWVLDEEELLMIAVTPENQRYNIGKALLDHMIARAIMGDRKKLYLEVRDGNPAFYFYKSNGFEEVGRRKDYYRGINGLIFDAISMCKLL
jgi:[ribosomal protein S18]-alanine N-acetyltransferase